MMETEEQQPLRVPKINANEEEVDVVGIDVSEGDFVEAGEQVCTFESTKATFDFEAPTSGYVRRLALEVGDRVEVGQLVCVLTATEDQSVDLDEEPAPTKSVNPPEEVRTTQRAGELIGEYELDASAIEHTGIVTERDVITHLERDGQDLRAPTDRPEPSKIDVDQAEDGAIVIYGAGGHARVIVDMIREARRDLEIIGIIDDADQPPEDVLGVPVVGDANRFGELRNRGVEMAALGIGAVTHNGLREELFNRLKRQEFRLPNLVHPDATVEPSVSMGRGNQIFGGAIVSSNVRLGDNGIVNSNTVVSHDCQIGDHVHLTPGALLAGNVTVGDRTVIGMGTTVYLGVDIGSEVTVTNGNHILEDIDDQKVIRTSAAGTS